MKKEEMTSAAPNAGEVDLIKGQVENVAEPTQSSTPQSPNDTSVSDEEAPTVVNGEQVQASSEATDGDAAAPTAGEGDQATEDTTEGNDAVQGDENTSAEQDSQAQATTGAGPEEPKSSKKKGAAKPKNTQATPNNSLNYSEEKK